ncbi:squalene/phytoene synthase family protein [Amylibacter sp. SFDW26]|uniref:squalene/phytoene synthase family protein n=1 Tax=Amylibacter sp. SFDW26 TaxID=2652722 RepID=UPI001D02DCEC|nr:squalene/phytoene synthase family protein [Amylibacter sp. SFDW26]
MSVEACADLVERGDPDRFLSAMTAPAADRGALMVLYAFNLEVVRAPWITAEAMIAEMRLQWWADAIAEIYDGKDVRRHEVVTPLAALINEKGLDRSVFEALIEARRWDIYKEPHADQAAMDQYIMDTSAGLLWLSAQAMGASQAHKDFIMDYGYGMGIAALLKAIPALENAQKYPLVDGTLEGVATLAHSAFERLRYARRNLQAIPKPIRAALRSGWTAMDVLKLALRQPELVAEGGLENPEFHRKTKLLWKTLTSRF